MTKFEFEKLLQRYLRGECTEAEKVKIKLWFDKLETDQIFQLSEKQEAQSEEILLAHINSKIDGYAQNNSNRRLVHLKRMTIYGSIAASVVLAFFLLRDNHGFFENPVTNDKTSIENIDYKTITKSNTKTSCELIVLEDSTKVRLTQGSTITYKNPFEKDRRVVVLNGSGFFQVSKNPRRPFFVFCNGTITKVIGTSFWVNSNSKSKSVEIGVKTGKVSVKIGQNEVSKQNCAQPSNEIFLTQNQRMVFFKKHGKVEKSLVPDPIMLDTPEVAELKFIYEDEPLPNVLKELGQSYNVRILMENDKLKQCSFTGDLTAMTFQEKFDLICESVNSKYNMQGTSIIITGSGCANSL